MKLYSYFRSSASFRVRIALNLKSLPYEYMPIHLSKGEQKTSEFASLTTEKLVPLLETDNGQRLTQSMAIMEYLDETHPGNPLLPTDASGRARVRALSQIVACEIHPLNNLRVLKYLVRDLKVSDDAKNGWYRHWVGVGLEAFEGHLATAPHSTYCHGDTPSMADCCLVPQIFNAQRFDCDLGKVPRTMAVFEACMKLDAFQKAQPSACPDYEA